MNEITPFMANDHDRLDGIFQQFQNVKTSELKKASELFSDFRAGLERHIVWEEEILFPLFETRTGMHDTGPTAVMRMEHRQIKGYVELIQKSISAGDAKTDELEQGLVGVLTSHNNKEESILYPWIDNSISDEERRESLKKMKEIPS